MASEAAIAADGGGGGGLIFQWERRARSRWRLALMLGVSLLVHAVSFYVFQVAYTPTGTQLPPPAQVVLVPLDQPENAPLAHWLTMNDPTLTMRPGEPAAAKVLDWIGLRYVPSYNAMQPPFKPLDPAGGVINTVPPRAILPGPVPVPVPANRPAPRDVNVDRATQVVLTGPIEAPVGKALPPVRFTVEAGANVLEPTVFLVGVRPDGGEPFFFRQAASGSTAADEYARVYLAGLGLRPATAVRDAAITWATATFYWGDDVYR